MILIWVWSIRLTHNYFRREKWEWGKREDWRFSDMRKQYGKHWWWISFFAVFLPQQVHLYIYFGYFVHARLIFVKISNVFFVG
jgi:steroid 5-alpha reductase family enzyme